MLEESCLEHAGNIEQVHEEANADHKDVNKSSDLCDECYKVIHGPRSDCALVCDLRVDSKNYPCFSGIKLTQFNRFSR